jgi:hypothetical protein
VLQAWQACSPASLRSHKKTNAASAGRVLPPGVYGGRWSGW